MQTFTEFEIVVLVRLSSMLVFKIFIFLVKQASDMGAYLLLSGQMASVCQQMDNTSLYDYCTFSPLVQITVGAGSPVIGTSKRSLFPATTTMVESAVRPIQSRWIFGGS